MRIYCLEISKLLIGREFKALRSSYYLRAPVCVSLFCAGSLSFLLSLSI